MTRFEKVTAKTAQPFELRELARTRVEYEGGALEVDGEGMALGEPAPNTRFTKSVSALSVVHVPGVGATRRAGTRPATG